MAIRTHAHADEQLLQHLSGSASHRRPRKPDRNAQASPGGANSTQERTGGAGVPPSLGRTSCSGRANPRSGPSDHKMRCSHHSQPEIGWSPLRVKHAARPPLASMTLTLPATAGQVTALPGSGKPHEPAGRQPKHAFTAGRRGDRARATICNSWATKCRSTPADVQSPRCLRDLRIRLGGKCCHYGATSGEPCALVGSKEGLDQLRPKIDDRCAMSGASNDDDDDDDIGRRSTPEDGSHTTSRAMRLRSVVACGNAVVMSLARRTVRLPCQSVCSYQPAPEY